MLAAGVRLLRGAARPGWAKVAFAGVFASVATLPYFWYLVPSFTTERTYLPVGEALVIAAEAAVFRFVLDLPYRPCLVLSAACNLCSLAAGLALARLA